MRRATAKYKAVRRDAYLIVLIRVEIGCSRHGPSQVGGERIQLPHVLTPTAIFRARLGAIVRTIQMRPH